MMSPLGSEAWTIEKPELVLVEGQDEVHLFSALLRRPDVGPREGTHIRSYGGIGKLPATLRTLPKTPGYENLRSLGIVRDADADCERAFQSVRTALANASLPTPDSPLQIAAGTPSVTVMILPPGRPCGMLEDVCLVSVADHAAMACVDEFFTCLTKNLDKLPREASKARVRAFLASCEQLEDSHFEVIRQNLGQWVLEKPSSSSVARAHAFLATRYKPDLDLGIAAQQTEPYWNFDHPVFEPIKEFLRNL
jgi:hypothetical protein